MSAPQRKTTESWEGFVGWGDEVAAEQLRNGSPNSDRPKEENDPMKKHFEGIISDTMKKLEDTRKKPSTQHQAEVTAIVNGVVQGWKEGRHMKTREENTILHLLARDKIPGIGESLVYKMFISLMLSKFPDIMSYVDTDGVTPLLAAVKARNYSFILACKMMPKQAVGKVSKALEVECDNDRFDRLDTCLEMAVKKQYLPEEVRIEIIRLAPKKAFERQDIRGRTPLHLAVAYERRSAAQTKVVSALLERGPSAMDIRTKTPPGLSVYQYQEYTRQDELDKARKDQSAGRRPSIKLGTALEDQAVLAPGDISEEELVKPKEGGKTREQSTTSLRDGVNGGSKEQAQGQTLQSLAEPQQPNGTSSQSQYFNDVRDMLKLWYLRNRRPNDAVDYLMTKDQKRKELWFDFGRSDYSISQDDFEAEFGHLDFDEILQYVSFRRGELRPGKKKSYVDERLRGRQDMAFFFDWLARKGVRHILTVNVDDGVEPHSDETIEKALAPFRVEVLDWRKVDLDVEVVKRVGNIEELHLLWSGNNLALRGWSEPGGLSAVPTLKVVHLHVRQTLDSDKRKADNLELFRSKLSEKKLVLEVHDAMAAAAQLGRHVGSKPASGHDVYSSHWIKCMDDFVRCFRHIKPPPIDPSTNIEAKFLAPITVALIDDGVDLPYRDSATQKFKGMSLHTYDNGRKVWPWFNSAAGHGTAMARFIHRLCPSAVIYPIKLETRGAEPGSDKFKLQIVPESAIKAIKYAAEQDVDIISMSWTCPAPEDTARRDWEDAISAAAKKNILMFCSASDGGQFGERTFPHACLPNITFRVGAAMPSGRMFEKVADAKDLDFALPGYEVFLDEDPERRKQPPGRDRLEAHTGSSVATALAAGLAALVLECVRIGLANDLSLGRQDDSTIVPDDLRAIRQRKNLKAAFIDGIGTSRDSASNANKFIMVDDVFGTYASKLADQGPTDQLETIASLAKLLLRKFRP